MLINYTLFGNPYPEVLSANVFFSAQFGSHFLILLSPVRGVVSISLLKRVLQPVW